MPGVTISAQGVGGADLSVHDDLGYAVLQTEFGYGRSQASHWRPAVRDLVTNMNALGEKFEKYLLTGNESLFEIDKDGDVSAGKLAKYGAVFERTIGQSAGLQ
jgi:hypothetical protein